MEIIKKQPIHGLLRLRNHRQEKRFIEETKTKKAIHTILITTIGLSQNEHSDIIDKTLIMSDLFE